MITDVPKDRYKKHDFVRWSKIQKEKLKKLNANVADDVVTT